MKLLKRLALTGYFFLFSSQQLLFAQSETVPSLASPASGYAIVERGEDHAIFQKISATNDASGMKIFQTNQFTLLENGLHYLENGEFKLSEDLIESFPDGAVARRGPNQVIFSPDLNTEAVFDIRSPEGRRVRGGVRAIQLTDLSTGKSLVLGTVRDSVKGQILPPNQILYADAFAGIDADVLLIWKHNYFSQDILLRSRPELPANWNAATVRLEVVTEFIVDAEPELRAETAAVEGQQKFEDDVVIRFGSLAMMVGKAFPADDNKAFALGGFATEGTPVVKQWNRTEDGRHFLVESLSWAEAGPHLKNLPATQQANNAAHTKSEIALARAWPKTPTGTLPREPIQVASAVYQPKGYLMDFVIIPDSGTPATLLSGVTYYIKTSYVSGSLVTFQPGCVIKYKDSAYMSLSGSVSFPPTGQMMPVFTSRNDDLFGDRIAGVSGETDSNGDPTLHRALPAISISYPTVNTVVVNARIRWARQGIDYSNGSGSGYTHHTVTDCLFQNCTLGIDIALAHGDVALSNVRKCNVTNAINVSAGSYTGSMTDDCGPFYMMANFTGLKESEDGVPRPDTQAAVGLTKIVEILNGIVAVYDKNTGTRISLPTTFGTTFFNVTIGGHTYPFDGIDPRIIYDVTRDRWVATALDTASGHVILAISKGSDPVGSGGANWVSDNWVKHLVPFGPGSTDYPTLGVDTNGVYVSAVLANSPNQTKIAAIPASIFSAQTSTVIDNAYITPFAGSGDCFPAVVPDGASSETQWYVTRGGLNQIWYKQITWNNGIPTVASSWTILTDPTAYSVSGAVTAPQLGSSIRIDPEVATLSTPIMRKVNGVRYLWTSQTVEVNGSGGAANPDRTAIEWIRITTGPTVAISSGLIWDSTTNAHSYHYGSIAVNKRGDLFLGSSGSSTNEYIGAYYIGCLNGGSWPTAPTRFYAGQDWFSSPVSPVRWGDYSAAMVDPDGFRFWTIQTYAETKYSTSIERAWGTRIMSAAP